MLNIQFETTNYIVAVALLLGTPLFVFFGWLSDRVGRKPIMIAGMVLGALLYIPIYQAMINVSGWNPAMPKAIPTNPNTVALTLLIFIQVVFVTMVYGPIAAFLVELFPTKMRYASMSLPYHSGNGVFGGLVPLICTTLAEKTHNPLAGLWYPIGIALVTAIIGGFFIHERPNVKLWDED